MTRSDMTSTPQSEPDESVTEFEVGDDGTLRMTDCDEAETRAEFYDSVASFWSRSPKDLAEAMDECQPLAWAVHSIYADFREELAAELAAAQRRGSADERKLSALKVRLEALPEEPEEGAAAWLLSLTGKAFEDRVVPEVEKWFEEPPNWSFEDAYLPASGTARGAALESFRDMAADDLQTLGVDIVEGEHPGSTYDAAELCGDIDEANPAAEAAGIPVRFAAAKA
jgi:hypothetical protein